MGVGVLGSSTVASLAADDHQAQGSKEEEEEEEERKKEKGVQGPSLMLLEEEKEKEEDERQRPVGNGIADTATEAVVDHPGPEQQSGRVWRGGLGGHDKGIAFCEACGVPVHSVKAWLGVASSSSSSSS